VKSRPWYPAAAAPPTNHPTLVQLGDATIQGQLYGITASPFNGLSLPLSSTV
jgi:hypothetical protein